MANTMTIGDFSRATRLSAKTLRFYHRVGLLEPARVDPHNGYRLYDADQIADAQVIRQFRTLEMPVDTIREVLAAPGILHRNALIAAHLERMEAHLESTRSAVAALRGLLVPTASSLEITHRSISPTPALVIRETFALAEIGAWFSGAKSELRRMVAAHGLTQSGPVGGLWDNALFLEEAGEAALFLPVTSIAGLPERAGRVSVETLPAVELAVATHRGTDDTIGEVYAGLGRYVAGRQLGSDGPMWESYVQEPSGPDGVEITEIGWPILSVAR
jgi:DNA-binding transcriptional MerR regulator